jgi:hypothetical protein
MKGNWLLCTCSDNNLDILNGTEMETASPGALTSFQKMGASVIDYAMVSHSPSSAIDNLHLHIESMAWSDHAILNLQFEVPLSGPSTTHMTTLPTHEMLTDKPVSELDLLFCETLDVCETEEGATAKLYGHVYYTGSSTMVYVATNTRQSDS